MIRASPRTFTLRAVSLIMCAPMLMQVRMKAMRRPAWCAKQDALLLLLLRQHGRKWSAISRSWRGLRVRARSVESLRFRARLLLANGKSRVLHMGVGINSAAHVGRGQTQGISMAQWIHVERAMRVASEHTPCPIRVAISDALLPPASQHCAWYNQGWRRTIKARGAREASAVHYYWLSCQWNGHGHWKSGTWT